MSVAERLELGKGMHELRLGKSFDEKSSNTAFISFRYDFKPASVDINKESTVVLASDKSVVVTVPHVEGAGKTHTVYKGNKRSLNKECVLLINRDTDEITLEKLSCCVLLKKTRLEVCNKISATQRPVTPIEKVKTSPLSKAPVKPHPSTATNIAPGLPKLVSKDVYPSLQELDMEVSSSSSSSCSSSGSSSDSDSDSESETKEKINDHHGNSKPPQKQETAGPTHFLQTLSQDLRLSDSSDDSD